jgi:hypothetical protein
MEAHLKSPYDKRLDPAVNIRFLSLIALLGPLSAGVPLEAAQPLFAIGFHTTAYPNSVLYRIDDYATAPKAAKIAETTNTFIDVAIDPTTQRFYATDIGSPQKLYELYPSNGTATAIQTVSGFQVGLAFDRGGQLWGWDANGGLYRINKQTGVSTLVGLSTYSGGGDLAFDTNGTLYATTGADAATLIRLNTNNASTVLVGNVATGSGQTVSNLWGLEIDSDGIMYVGRGVVDSGIYTGRAELYRVNKTTAAATAIGTTPAIDFADGFSLAGLSFLGKTTAPLPPTNSIYVAVELGWKSESNRYYQVQWRTNANTGAWSNLGSWVLGNGSTNYIFDSTRGTKIRFYRVQALQ